MLLMMMMLLLCLKLPAWNDPSNVPTDDIFGAIFS